MANEIKKAVDDVADTLKEGVHRAKADVEHERRAEYGDSMTGTEKVTTVTREVSEKGKAEADRLKRGVRDLT